MNNLTQTEIRELEDKDLQLMYMLGSLYTFYPSEGIECDRFWVCNVRCRRNPVENDERLEKIKSFIKKHNISNSTFLRLARTYLTGSINSYKGNYGSLIPELDLVLKDYNFTHTNYWSFKENDLKEKELIELIERERNLQGSNLNNFLKNYSLTMVDFIILAKTSINHAFRVVKGFERTDLSQDLNNLLESNNLYETYEFVQAYRESLEQLPQKKSLKELCRSLIKGRK